jgi:hypothetical protein
MAKTRKNRGGPIEVKPAPPVVNLDAENPKTEGAPKTEKKLELFEFEGKKYYMGQPGANLMLKVLKEARSGGMIVAVGTLLYELIGEDAYDTLMGIDDLEDEELNAIVERVMHFSMGKLDAVLGN